MSARLPLTYHFIKIKSVYLDIINDLGSHSSVFFLCSFGCSCAFYKPQDLEIGM